MLDTFTNILNTYWNNSFYQYMFYFSLILIPLLDIKPERKILFFWFPLLSIIFLLNPISLKVEHFIWGQSIEYYCRQISNIPIFYVISYTFVLILENTNKKIKLIMVAFFSAMIVFFGSFTYSRDDYTYTRSDNAYKIPNDLISICDSFSDEDDITLATSINLNYLVRQYKPSIKIATSAREISDFTINLGSSNPNVGYILQVAASRNCNYIVVNNEQSVIDAFNKYSLKASFSTESYLLYKIN